MAKKEPEQARPPKRLESEIQPPGPPPETPSIWQRLGIDRKKLTLGSVIGAVLTIVVFCIVNIDKIEKTINILFTESPPVPQPVTPSSPPPTPTPACLSGLSVRTFKRFPYYLVNTYNNNPESPHIYWIAISGKSECEQPVHIVTEIEVIGADLRKQVVISDNKYEYTIPARKEIFKRPGPKLEFLTKIEQNIPLRVRWTILNKKTGNVLDQGRSQVIVMPQKSVCWDLKDPMGKVHKEFLLASLAAWTLKPGKDLQERAQHYLQDARNPKEWLTRCYVDLFHTPRGIRVKPCLGRWPPLGEEDVKTPLKTLESQSAYPLEAAILIAALKKAGGEALDFPLALFAIDRGGNRGVKQFLLAWSVDRRHWQAVDLSQTQEHSFEENIRLATERLNAHLEALRTFQEVDVTRKLEEKGVFIDSKETILAVNFERATEKFFIGPLEN